MWHWRVTWFSSTEVGVVLIVLRERDFCHHVRVKRNNKGFRDLINFIGKLKHYKVVMDEAIYLKQYEL